MRFLCHDIQDDDTKYNNTQHCDTQFDDTHLNTTQYNGITTLFVITVTVITLRRALSINETENKVPVNLLSDVMQRVVAECNQNECSSA
jgi:hypothetical protein